MIFVKLLISRRMSAFIGGLMLFWVEWPLESFRCIDALLPVRKYLAAEMEMPVEFKKAANRPPSCVGIMKTPSRFLHRDGDTEAFPFGKYRVSAA